MPGETTNDVNGHNGTSNGASGAMDIDAEAQFDSIPEVIRDFKDNKFVIVLDSLDRENEGDLIIAAENITDAQMSFLIRYTSGYVCVPVPVTRTAELGLKQMVDINKDPNKTAYTISVDAAVKDISTGISAHDRALTCRMLANQTCKAEAFRKPGHIIPLQARKGGVRVRPGHTEAAVDLCRLAGKEPVGVICEMVIDGQSIDGKPELVGGGMMRRDECLAFGKQWGIKVCTIEALVRYIKETQGEYTKEEEETRMAVGI